MNELTSSGPGVTDAPSWRQPSPFIPSGFRQPVEAILGSTAIPHVGEGTNRYDARASAPGLDVGSSNLDGGTVTSSFMAPIFHLTSDDSTILAMEHNNHVKLLAISSSRLELLVTNTTLMPVIENQGVEASGDDPFATQHAPPLDVRLLDWNPAAHSVLVDRLRAPCTQLLWAPWQHGTYLGALCAGHSLSIYRYSHGRWALDATIPASDCTAFAFSCHFTIACACTNGTVRLLTRRSAVLRRIGTAVEGPAGRDPSSMLGADGGAGDGGEAAAESGLWDVSGCFQTASLVNHSGTDGSAEEDDEQGSQFQPDCLSVGFNEHGQLLVAGYADGSVRVFSTTHESRRLGALVFLHEAHTHHSQPLAFPDPCRQVTWAPSAGRSFLMLALVYPHRVSLLLFRRSLLSSSAAHARGPSHDKSDRLNGDSTWGERRTPVALPSGTSAASSRQLALMATASVSCEEVAKLSWNTTGTRFVTSHTDSFVQAWVVGVAYKQNTQNENESDSVGGETGSLHLEVTIRKISTVHPYHATGTR